jgi:23S rRNA (uridine2552-2'-O)-methyltransferase
MYDRKDAFYRKAKKEGYKSRAAYKLMELNKKYALYNPNSRILDAGCAPGGWSQVVLETVKKQPVVGVDLIQVEGMGHPNFHFVLGDLTVTRFCSGCFPYALSLTQCFRTLPLILPERSFLTM